ncbi:MAG: DNA polymerase III subunit beta [Candidatus Nealsonbacteria bacterium RBG_13_42_11]|uniref:Beta sliding clamp n=1 Tax=Candidatus Nealsonbacteria bacterium RBG_13_42_11 TaxID=1801663 RepID=A0A1G2DZZ1_9BACT|nr:MAG: DNA polymerase III subunit beta [Candidatus Nealsonbacteria bacterium RBG_13_42_11]
MKTVILKEKLKEGINTVERISEKSLTLPILNNVLISTEKNFLNLTTTDLEVGINWWSLVKTEREGKIAVPSRVLSSFVNFLPDKPVELEVKDLTLKIKCDDYQTSIKGFNPEDFPIIPKVISKEKVVIKSQVFCQNLSRVVDVASFSSTKPEISGIYFLFQKNLIVMAATDSFRLGETKIFLESPKNNLTKDYSLILPQKAAKEIINILGGGSGDLTICFSPNQILFETGLTETSHPKIQLVSRLIEGDYPNYQEIIPKKSETKIQVSLNEIINQIKLSSLFSSKINEVKLKIDPKKNQLNIFSQNPDVGEYNSFLNAKIDGKPFEISFNYRFLLDGLLNIGLGREKETEVILELNGSDKPGVIKAKGDESYLYLVMPIKTN